MCRIYLGIGALIKVLKTICKLLGMKKSYVSEADGYLNQEDFIKNSPSCSQKKEIKKHENIYSRVIDKRIKWD